jgi:hypothetical protein
MKRIHIVGTGPRTGTTLLAEMMIACFDIDVHTEHEDSIYTWPPCRGNIFLTKKPRDILVIEPILRIMRKLYVIYMVRDPRDMIVSKHRREPERYWANLQFWKTYTSYGRRLQSHPRFISVRYEDLVMQPDQIQNYLMKRMPFLIKKTSFNRYHEISQPSKDSLIALGGVRPASLSSIGNWRKHLSRVAGQIQLHGSISKDLIAYGYEQDDAWEKELEGIAPDLRASHFPEIFTVKRLKRWNRGKYVKALGVVVGQYRVAQSVRNLLKAVCRKVGSPFGDS